MEKITVRTIVAVDAQSAWEIWTNPKHITQWNSANDDWHTPHAENDLKTGGRFKSRMESRDGKMGFDFEGTYTEVKVNEIIKYDLGDKRKVEITFHHNGNHTLITETFDPENENSAELQQQGWQAILDNFKKYAESKSKK